MRTHSLTALYCFAALLAAPFALSAADDAEQAVLGNWLVQSRDGIIGISRASDGTLEGRIAGGSDNTRLDSKNPDPSKRQNHLRGSVIMMRLHYAGNAEWTGGSIYDPDSGKLYKVKMKLVDDTHLHVRGFLGVSLLGRTQNWTRYTGTSMDLPKGGV